MIHRFGSNAPRVAKSAPTRSSRSHVPTPRQAVFASLLFALVVWPAQRSTTVPRPASASAPAQVFPTSPRIHLPLALSRSAPIHSTGAPPPPTSTSSPTPAATETPTATAVPADPTAAPTLDATPAPTATLAIHVLLPDEDFDDFPFDPVTIVAASIDGDSVDLSVRYGGGCMEHDFRLLAGRAIMESFPPQADVRLSHNANGDLCRALLLEELRFDLVPLKEYYKGDRDTPGPLLLRLRGWDDLLRYEFP